jgi:hypothetical protein
LTGCVHLLSNPENLTIKCLFIIDSNRSLTGIVAAQLYDYATPYQWTMKMRESFKYTSLLTSQCELYYFSPTDIIFCGFYFSELDSLVVVLAWHEDTQHGLAGNAADCQQHIIDYFSKGYVSFVDGTVCGADYADSSIIAAAFGLGK